MLDRRLTLGIPLTALLLLAPACDDGDDADGVADGDTGGAPFDDDLGPPTEEMQELMPDGELPLQWVFVDGEWVSGWRIADATTGDEQTRPATSEVYLFCADSEYDACPMMAPPKGDNVFPTIPRDAEYSPYWQVVKVRVPDDYVPDSIKSVETIIASGYEVEALPMIVNCPIHGLTATLEGDGDPGFVKTPTARAWYEGHRVYYWDFGFLPYADGGTEVVTSATGYLTYRSGADLPESEPLRGEDLNGDGDTHDTNHVFSLVPFSPDFPALGGRVELRAVDVDATLPLATDGEAEGSALTSVADVEAAIGEGTATARSGGDVVETWNFGLRRIAP